VAMREEIENSENVNNNIDDGYFGWGNYID
jgi:hypothetical protein